MPINKCAQHVRHDISFLKFYVRKKITMNTIFQLRNPAFSRKKVVKLIISNQRNFESKGNTKPTGQTESDDGRYEPFIAVVWGR